MNIIEIIYDTTREIYSVEDKMSIAALFLFCEKLGNYELAELLYCDDKAKFIKDLNKKYKNFEVDLSIRLSDVNVSRCFDATIEAIIATEDKDGYLKALYNRDEFVIVIEGVVSAFVAAKSDISALQKEVDRLFGR